MKDKLRLFPVICGECGSGPGEPCTDRDQRHVKPSQRLPSARVHQTRINRAAARAAARMAQA